MVFSDGRWKIGSAEKNSRGIRSTSKAGKMAVPPETGWEYHKGAGDWAEDQLLTVTGKLKTLLTFYH